MSVWLGCGRSLKGLHRVIWPLAVASHAEKASYRSRENTPSPQNRSASLGLSTPEAEKPPPQREILRVAEHGEGWGVPAEWE
jgi:hypothetical protein